MHGVVPPQVQDPAFALVEPQQVPLCPTFQPVQVTLNGSTANAVVTGGSVPASETLAEHEKSEQADCYSGLFNSGNQRCKSALLKLLPLAFRLVKQVFVSPLPVEIYSLLSL